MDVEDYFIIALIFAIVAFISNLASYGYIFNNPFSVADVLRVYTFYTAIGLLIFPPSVYLAIAFALGGIVKAIVKVIEISIKEDQEDKHRLQE